MSEASVWRRCSACKGPIAHGQTHWICNVSTCNRSRTALFFCSVSCWEVHLPSANHREAWALERKAPSRAEAAAAEAVPERREASAERSGQRRLVRGPAPSRAPAPSLEVLVVASRLKDYIRARSGFHTSDRVLEPLSEHVRRLCERAIENARREGRMTVLDRDVPED